MNPESCQVIGAAMAGEAPSSAHNPTTIDRMFAPLSEINKTSLMCGVLNGVSALASSDASGGSMDEHLGGVALARQRAATHGALAP
jgi:hypothetical protein